MNNAQLISALKAQGLRPRSYSGRGMNGAECVGASLDHPGNYELPRGWSQDSLGMGYIVYWPDVAWQEEGEVAPGQFYILGFEESGRTLLMISKGFGNLAEAQAYADTCAAGYKAFVAQRVPKEIVPTIHQDNQ